MIEIAVIGGGYAGLGAIGALQDVPHVHITLIDPGTGHQLIPELPEALSRQGLVSNHVVPYDQLLTSPSVSLVTSRATSIDWTLRTITSANGSVTAFNWLVLAPGSEPSLPPIPGLRQFAHPLRDAADTLAIKESLRYHKEQRIVVVGGGLTGVEVAGMLAPDHDVVLIEAAPRLLPALGKGLAEYALRRLQRSGVITVLGQKVQAVENHSVILERDHYGFDVLIWAGGIAVPAWVKDLGLPLDNRGYPLADPYGKVGDQVYVAGDLWRVVVDGQEVAATAQLAALAGTYVGELIARQIQGEPVGSPFLPRLRGMLISLDPGQGVGWVLHGGIPVRGMSARTLKSLSFHQYRQKLARRFNKPWLADSNL
ncbi:MAG: FAD-dependent oxidoreductase [Sulfobacillus benefaciens]|uniref:FAD-dependent oxidoreductase n=1 Tax=Sulfobacillus benefaciens TaxID=453960 RepID=A0A2T2XG31_9FIRM|nr:MAG: FAD-dependent oxidoreductase [Sulfobacillus benefaciens]